MTKLIVTPIDMSAPGSFLARKKLLRSAANIQRALKGGTVLEMADALDEMEALVVPRLETDDGTPPADALEQLSADDFDRLVGVLLRGETIPNAKSAP